MNGWADIYALVFYNNFTFAALVGIGLAYSVKDQKTSFYFLLISIGFILNNALHGQIRAIDPDKIYRYGIWSFLEFLLLTVMVYFSFVKNKINQLMAITFSIIIIISIFSLLYRAIDRHITDLPWAFEIITTFPLLSNAARVAIGYIPLAILFYTFIKRKFNDNHNNNDSGTFFACTLHRNNDDKK